MSTQPDTSEAVEDALTWLDPAVANTLKHVITDAARIAIEADRKALAEAGYVVAPVVKLPADVLEMGVADLLRDLIAAGLPIELETEQ